MLVILPCCNNQKFLLEVPNVLWGTNSFRLRNTRIILPTLRGIWYAKLATTLISSCVHASLQFDFAAIPINSGFWFFYLAFGQNSSLALTNWMQQKWCSKPKSKWPWNYLLSWNSAKKTRARASLLRDNKHTDRLHPHPRQQLGSRWSASYT